MLSLNTIEILKSLDKRELKRLGEFIRSPYFNTIERLAGLYDIIVKTYPDFPAEKLNSEKLFSKLYPAKGYTYKTFKNLCSEFGKVLRMFLAYEEIQLNKNMIDLNLAQAFSRRSFFDISNKVITESKKHNKNSSNGKQFWYSYMLQNEQSKNLYNAKKLNLQEIFDSNCLMTESLIAFFLSTFSNSAYHILLSLKTQNLEFKNAELLKFIRSFNSKKLLKYLESSKLMNSDSIKVYILFLDFINNGFTEKEYFKLKKMLIENIDKFTSTDIINFWESIINILAIELLPLNKKFNREIFEMNDFFYKLDIYSDDSLDRFPKSLLRNAFTSALILEEYEWADNFLNEYVDFIDPSLKEDEINYNRALLSFKLNKYEESLESLSKVNFTDIYENLNTRFYCIMNHIELKHYDSADSMVNSARQFYKTCKDIPEFAGILVTDALKFFKEIIKCEKTGIKLDYSIYKEASASKRYYHKKYILAKMERLL